jgi:hypothetical protein
MEKKMVDWGNRARSFNEVRADLSQSEIRYRLEKGQPMITQAEIERMVRDAIAKAAPAPLKPLPVLRILDPVETLIEKADRGTADPRMVEAEIETYVAKSKRVDDRNAPAVYARLAKEGDKTFNRLYALRQHAARTFRSGLDTVIGKSAAMARMAERDAAAQEAKRIEAEIDRQAAELRTHSPKLTKEAARVQVMDADKGLYSAWLVAHNAAKA